MKKIYITIISVLVLSISVQSQDFFLSYHTYTWKSIFNETNKDVSYFIQTSNGIAEITTAGQGKEVCEAATWTWPIINSSLLFNYVHFNEVVGFATGLEHTNYGAKNSYLINFDTQTPILEQARNFVDQNKVFAIGIPAIIQVGRFDPDLRFYIYGGASVYWNYLHAKKQFIGDEEFERFMKINSPEVDLFSSSLYLGVTFFGYGLQFGIMPNGFYKRDYVNSLKSEPYANVDKNIFFFKITYNSFSQFE